jgi:preprotein translocase subunit YajC
LFVDREFFAMHENFEWMRIAFAMGLMLVGFILLPAFFLMRDKRQEEREAAAALEYSRTNDEAGAGR